MSALTLLLKEKPWARHYLFVDPDLKENDIVFEENIVKFNFFISSIEEVEESSDWETYALPKHQATVELLAVFKVMRKSETILEDERLIFLDALTSFVRNEFQKGRSLDDLFRDKDALAISRLYQVADQKWAKKYLTWVLYELGVISMSKGPDLFGENDSASQTYTHLKRASNEEWRPQRHFSIDERT
ncbi:hypothetical protein [Alkalibacterium sp. MB6]|uniref:hypothetical protein n=1 Tax=Alkalibacterium sp. MB6 TaxID=2081965 RepID=UPI001379B145|nr:hypothetical protein [Alkalibacterium sp. MB6]